MPSYLSRYLAGEFQQVWDEISGLVYDKLDEETKRDVEAVCRETMSRVRQNAQVLINALDSMGFQFGLYPDKTTLPVFEGALGTPDVELAEKIASIESQAGALPLTLRIFWEQVGSICLIGYYSDWPDESDPLNVDSLDASLDELASWMECFEDAEMEEAEETLPFRAVIAPDSITKDNVSGGDWYGIELPCVTVDGVITEEPHQTTLVNYLRIAFRAKGFPGCDDLPARYANLPLELIEF